LAGRSQPSWLRRVSIEPARNTTEVSLYGGRLKDLRASILVASEEICLFAHTAERVLSALHSAIRFLDRFKQDRIVVVIDRSADSVCDSNVFRR